MEYISEFKDLSFGVDESGKEGSESFRGVASGRSLQLECARVLHKCLLVSVLMYGGDPMVWIRVE